jgi:hypothetical protein
LALCGFTHARGDFPCRDFKTCRAFNRAGAAAALLALACVTVAATDLAANAELFRLGAEFKDAKRLWLAAHEEADKANNLLDADFPVPGACGNFG